MVIQEFGILFREKNLVKLTYIQSGIDFFNIIRKELVISLLKLLNDVFLRGTIDYLGGKDYIIAFIEDQIIVEDLKEPETLIVYCIFNYRKKIEKYVYKIIIPLLMKILSEFKSNFKNINLSDLSQIEFFSQKIDEILGDETKTVDQKFSESLF